jgi:integrase
MRSKENSGNWLKRNLSDSADKNFAENYENRTSLAETWDPKDVIERLKKVKSRIYRNILSLQYIYGSRISEIVKMRKRDLTFDIDGSLVAHIQTEKRRDGHVKVLGVNPQNSPELIPLLKDIVEYLDMLKDLDNEAYLFGDPEFFKVVKHGKEYLDNKLRMRVYCTAIKEAGLNPHLLRHARLSWLAHTKKKALENVDRLLLVKSVADFTRFDSAESYVRNMNLKQIKEAL